MTVSVTPKPKSKDIWVEDLDSVLIGGIAFWRNPGSSDALERVDRLHELLEESQGYKEKYQWLCSLIDKEQENAVLQLSMCKGLNFNSIEAEGYLRAVNKVKSLVNHVEENS